VRESEDDRRRQERSEQAAGFARGPLLRFLGLGHPERMRAKVPELAGPPAMEGDPQSQQQSTEEILEPVEG
jgi:hypothetical protein